MYCLVKRQLTGGALSQSYKPENTPYGSLGRCLHNLPPSMRDRATVKLYKLTSTLCTWHCVD